MNTTFIDLYELYRRGETLVASSMWKPVEGAANTVAVDGNFSIVRTSELIESKRMAANKFVQFTEALAERIREETKSKKSAPKKGT